MAENLKMPLMKCGCVAQGYLTSQDGIKLETSLPGCLIHDCYEPADEIPDLTGRTARCTYFGRSKPNRRYANDECNYGCKGNNTCKCGNIPSDYGLAFFQYKPDAEQDEFYCGCFGWD